MVLTRINLNDLREPVQVARAQIDEQGIEELAADIRTNGVIQPLHVKEVAGGYEVVDGHRRLLASRRANLAVVPCLVLSRKDASELVVKIHANLHRQDWTPVEEAAFYAELLPQCDDDTDKLAALVKQSRNYVENRLLLLRGDPAVLEAVVNREITLGVAQELNKIRLDKDRAYYLGWAKQTGATIATVRQWRAICEAQAQATPPAGGNGEPVVYSSPVEYKPLVCYLCGQAEPLSDVEFHYIHKSCRRMVEAQAEARKE